MICNTADPVALAPGVTCNRGHIGMERRSDFSVQFRRSILCREDDMEQGKCVGFRHGESIDRASGSCLSCLTFVLGVPAQRQRRAVIPAWGAAPGKGHQTTRGPKARPIAYRSLRPFAAQWGLKGKKMQTRCAATKNIDTPRPRVQTAGSHSKKYPTPLPSKMPTFRGTLPARWTDKHLLVNTLRGMIGYPPAIETCAKTLKNGCFRGKNTAFLLF